MGAGVPEQPSIAMAAALSGTVHYAPQNLAHLQVITLQDAVNESLIKRVKLVGRPVEERIEQGRPPGGTLVALPAPKQAFKVGHAPDLSLEFFICRSSFHIIKILIISEITNLSCNCFETGGLFFNFLPGKTCLVSFPTGHPGRDAFHWEHKFAPTHGTKADTVAQEDLRVETANGQALISIACNRHAPNGEVPARCGCGWKTHTRHHSTGPNGRNG